MRHILIVLIATFKEIIEVLRKEPRDRNNQDIDIIMEQTKDIPFFKNYIQRGDYDGNI